MATKSQRYDHPAYTAVGAVTASVGAGAGAVGGKFVAFTTILLKSATLMVTVAGTSTAASFNDYTFNIFGTATTSVGYSGNLGTTAAYAVGTNIVIGGGTTTMTQGEMICATRGTDATAQADITYEYVVQPGADLTV